MSFIVLVRFILSIFCQWNRTTFEDIDVNKSLKIIETSSEPDLISRAAINNSISSFGSDLGLDKIVTDSELRCNINTRDVDKQENKINTQNEIKPRKIIFDDEKNDKEIESVKLSFPNLSDQDSVKKDSNKMVNNINVHKSPAKCNLFEHIRSPVAMYIKRSPQVPLLQNVKPEKLLAGNHSIDVGNCWKSKSNVDYKPLPSVAYKSAENVKLVWIHMHYYYSSFSGYLCY